MPLIAPTPPPPVMTLVPATPGFAVKASVPSGTSTAGIPVPSKVVAWAALADPDSPGGVRLDPVFLADGRAWTPDQFRAEYGAAITLEVAAA